MIIELLKKSKTVNDNGIETETAQLIVVLELQVKLKSDTVVQGYTPRTCYWPVKVNDVPVDKLIVADDGKTVDASDEAVRQQLFSQVLPVIVSALERRKFVQLMYDKEGKDNIVVHTDNICEFAYS